MNHSWRKSFLVFLSGFICAGIIAGPANGTEKETSIQGRVYVSYSGDPSHDVMYANNIEVLLLRGTEDLEKKFESLKATRVAHIRAQEGAVLKALRELRGLLRKEMAKKEAPMREAVKRETEKYDKLRSEYEKEVRVFLEPYVIQRTKTNEEGKFSFRQLSPGRHFLQAYFEIVGAVNRFYWLHPVEVKANDELDVTLNKATMTPLYEGKENAAQ